MLISHRKQFIYTKTYKTAGTSVEVYFEPYCMQEGEWKEVLNSDAKKYGGSGINNQKTLTASAIPQHGKSHSLKIIIPPLATVIFESA